MAKKYIFRQRSQSTKIVQLDAILYSLKERLVEPPRGVKSSVLYRLSEEHLLSWLPLSRARLSGSHEGPRTFFLRLS